MAVRKRGVRRKKAAPRSIGLTVAEAARDPAQLDTARQSVAAHGGAVLGAYHDPFGGHPLLLVALPVDAVEPTPFQRDPSEAHVKRLMAVIEKIGRFLDPIVLVRHDKGFWTPNGNHRLQAVKKLGGRTIVGLFVPEAGVAYTILALNTEKAHNLREKSLETIRMARGLAATSKADEISFAFEFEQPHYLTLGAAYEERPRLSGGAYQSLLRRVDAFLDRPIAEAVRERERRSRRLLKLDDAVSDVVERLKGRGLTSPYLKPFVVARVDFTRFAKATAFDFDAAIDRVIAGASKFNVERVKPADVARTGGGAPDEESV